LGKQTSKSNNPRAKPQYINAQLEVFKSRFTILFGISTSVPCKLDNIFNEYIPIRKEEYILSCYRKYVSRIQKSWIEIKQNTYEKFVYVGNHLEALSSGNLKNGVIL
jgi:hypothetical protein